MTKKWRKKDCATLNPEPIKWTLAPVTNTKGTRPGKTGEKEQPKNRAPGGEMKRRRCDSYGNQEGCGQGEK